MDKKIHRFLVESIPSDSTFPVTTEKLVHQLAHVLRIKEGETFILFENNGPDVLVQTESVSKKEIVVSVISKTEPSVKLNRNVSVCMSMIRKERFEIAVEKLTELGVSSIIPIESHRTVRGHMRTDRLQSICDEALEQCGGNVRVIINEPLTLKEALEVNKNKESIVFSEKGEKLKSSDVSDSIVIYIGPEGGWAKEDEDLFNEYKIRQYTLGERTLRAETAAIVATHKLIWD